MTDRLHGKVALVTGAARGIGAGIARRLAADGAVVAVNYSRSEAAAQTLVAQIMEAGGQAFAVKADVSDLGHVRRMIADLADRVGQLDILVNNAGRGVGLHTLDETSVEDYDFVFALNTRGLFFVTQLAARMMRDGGRIVSLSTTGTKIRMSSLSVYAGSKAATEAFTRIWARELAGRQITVNCVCPGMVDTDMITQGMPAGAKEAAARHHPFRRIGQPADLADALAFLCSADARWVSGQTIVVDGGLT